MDIRSWGRLDSNQRPTDYVSGGPAMAKVNFGYQLPTPFSRHGVNKPHDHCVLVGTEQARLGSPCGTYAEREAGERTFATRSRSRNRC